MQICKTTRNSILMPMQAVCGIIEKNTTMPILQNVFLNFSDGNLTAISSDMEIQITANGTVESSSSSAVFTVNAKKIMDIIKSLPIFDEVSLAYDEKKLTIKSGKSKFNLQTLPSDDYPSIKQDKKICEFKIKQNELKYILSLTQYAMARNDIRYYLNGLLFDVKDGLLSVSGTDGNRLAIANYRINSSNDIYAIVPYKIISELYRKLSDNENIVDVAISGRQVVFKFNDIEFISKLIDGKYPDVQRVIPANANIKLTIDTQELQDAIKRASILSNEKFRGVNLELNNGIMKIFASNSEAEESIAELDIEYNFQQLNIGFNADYLVDCLSNIHSDKVEISFTDSTSSVLFTIPDNQNFKYVVMPMRM